MRTLAAALLLPSLLLGAACQREAAPPAPAPDSGPDTASAATPTADQPVREVVNAQYRCGDQLIGAEFDNTAGQVVLSLNTRRVPLAQAVSASGARYADAAGNEFWSKGDSATLTLEGQVLECATTDETSAWDEARARGAVFRGLGTEPFWSLEVEGGPAPRIVLDLDVGERRLVATDVVALDGDAGWRATAEDGSAVELRVTRGRCSDGMSDQDYPASLALKVGSEEFTGCGAYLQED